MILKYGKRLLFKRGVTVSISLLYECTLNCSYCSLKMGGKIHPKDTIIHGSDYWVDYIDSFPVKIKEIFLSGGEPGIYSGIADLTNELINRGYFVTLFTNLTLIDNFMAIEPNPRLKFMATAHKGANLYIFEANYLIMKEHYRIDVDEIETNFFKFSNKKKFCTDKDESDTSRFRIDSDGAIYVNCIERNKKHL